MARDADKRRLWVEKNRERIRLLQSNWRKAHPEYIREKKKEYLIRHPEKKEKGLDRLRLWSENNKDRRRDTILKWNVDNPDKVREIKKRTRKKNATQISEYRKKHNKETRHIARKYENNRVNNLSACYVRALLASQIGVSATKIPDALVIAKTETLKVKRLIRMKNENT